jgi:hypothetical protein
MKIPCSVTIDCLEGPEDERFCATIVARNEKCDVVSKAESLLRISAICGRRSPRPIIARFQFDDGDTIEGRILSESIDMHQRGSLAKLMSELLEKRQPRSVYQL